MAERQMGDVEKLIIKKLHVFESQGNRFQYARYLALLWDFFARKNQGLVDFGDFMPLSVRPYTDFASLPQIDNPELRRLAEHANAASGKDLPDEVELFNLYSWLERPTSPRILRRHPEWDYPNPPASWGEFIEGLSKPDRNRFIKPIRRAGKLGHGADGFTLTFNTLGELRRITPEELASGYNMSMEGTLVVLHTFKPAILAA